MHATHYYENRVKENEIFYRRPGPMLYTVYAYARNGKNDITNGQVAKEIVMSTVLGGIGAIGVTIAAGVTVATMGAALAPAAFAGLAAEAVAGGAGLLAGASVADVVASGAGVLSTTYGAYKNARAAARALGLACEKSKLYCERKGNYGGGSGSWLVVEGGPYMDKHGRFQPRDLSIRAATQEEIANGVFTEVSHEKFHTREGLQCTRRCPYCRNIVDEALSTS